MLPFLSILLHISANDLLFWDFSRFLTQFSQASCTLYISKSLLSESVLLSLHGYMYFPVKLSNYIIVKAPSNPQRNLPFELHMHRNFSENI